MAQQANHPNHPLPAGFQLDDYRIERQLSLGGFSIVYLATDRAGVAVAIKEYLPRSLSLRGEGGIRPLISAAHLPAFRHGMKCFFEEGSALARLSHPNVVRVLNFFRGNDTVYMVMQYERGRTLQEMIQKKRACITDDFIRTVFTRLLNGLREVHAHKLLHLDLKPSNIYMRNDRHPILIDFGAARRMLALDTPMITPTFTPGFASPEHYDTREQLGPWSDIYGVGASMYACLAGSAPQAADARRENDQLVPATTRWEQQFSRQLLETIDGCLRLDPLERPQSVFALQKALSGKAPATPLRSASRIAKLLGRIGEKIGRK